MRTVPVDKIEKKYISWKKEGLEQDLARLGPAAESWPCDAYHIKKLAAAKRWQNGHQVIGSWTCPVRNRIFVWRTRRHATTKAA